MYSKRGCFVSFSEVGTVPRRAESVSEVWLTLSKSRGLQVELLQARRATVSGGMTLFTIRSNLRHYYCTAEL